MSKPALSALKDVVDRAAKAAGVPPSSLTALDAWGQCPPLDRIDGAALTSLTSLTRLSLSTNAIDRVAGVGGLPSLRVLSLGRNALRRLDGVEAATGLEELWVSYNQLDKLVRMRRRGKGWEKMGC
jgi:dynein light chain 1, axonemal